MQRSDPETTQSLESSDTETVDELSSLVTNAMGGNRFAFQQLMDQFQERIYRMVYYRTRAKMDAEDITQDVFIQAFNHMTALKSPKRFKGWLYQIAVNKVRDYHRKRRFRSFFSIMSVDEEPFEQRPEAADTDTAEGQLLKKDFWVQVDRLLVKMSKMEREIFLLRYFDQLGIKEMAQALGKGESTVKTHLYRAMKKFKSMSDQSDFSFTEGLQ